MHNHFATAASRRSFLRSVSSGFGALAFVALHAKPAAAASASPLAPKSPHFTPRAKRVLFLCMEGGPSHVDSFDYKPELIRQAGKPLGKGRIPSALLVPPVWDFK